MVEKKCRSKCTRKSCKCTPKAEKESKFWDFCWVGAISRVDVVNLAVLACVVRRGTDVLHPAWQLQDEVSCTLAPRITSPPDPAAAAACSCWPASVFLQFRCINPELPSRSGLGCCHWSANRHVTVAHCPPAIDLTQLVICCATNVRSTFVNSTDVSVIYFHPDRQQRRRLHLCTTDNNLFTAGLYGSMDSAFYSRNWPTHASESIPAPNRWFGVEFNLASAQNAADTVQSISHNQS